MYHVACFGIDQYGTHEVTHLAKGSGDFSLRMYIVCTICTYLPIRAQMKSQHLEDTTTYMNHNGEVRCARRHASNYKQPSGRIYVDLAMCIEPRDLCKTFRAPILGSDDDSAVIVLTS